MERLSGLDASFLYLETPKQHMHVAMAAVIDPSEIPGGYSFERIQRLIASKVHLIPPLRRRLVEVPLNLHHPIWVDDPDFDIIHHVRRVAAPAPGTDREFAAMCGRICSTPLDRSRPLWELWVIEGLEGGKFALVAKVHHAAVDGQTGAGFLIHFFSLTPEIVEPEPPKPIEAPEIPTDAEMLEEALRERMQQPASLLKLARKTIENVTELLEVRREAQPESVGGTPLTAPRCVWNGSLTAKRSAAFARLPLDGIKEIKNAFGCTVNDVVLAIASGTLRRYLEKRDELPEVSLLACCPISVAPAAGPKRGANHVSAMFTSLATNEPDPAKRLKSIQEHTKGAKQEHNAIGADMLQNWAEFAAPSTFNLAMRFYSSMKLADKHPPVHNLVISNVPGPPFPIYLAGAEVKAIYPMGPVMEGAGLNLTVMSYRGNVDFGFMVAADLVPDVWDMAESVEPSYEELLAAARAMAASASADPG
ncbi:MAG: wax ester/triacylglycerol synthase family O-acyltransferase [Sandaracinaceae bacterium]|nr:wax ester/triacylglycerol synthase family O-acyltransferase [Sandaracinaceae bacterium]